MTRATSNFVWALAMLFGAFVLAKKDVNPIPWALGVIAAIVGIASLVAILAENDKI